MTRIGSQLSSSMSLSFSIKCLFLQSFLSDCFQTWYSEGRQWGSSLVWVFLKIEIWWILVNILTHDLFALEIVVSNGRPAVDGLWPEACLKKCEAFLKKWEAFLKKCEEWSISASDLFVIVCPPPPRLLPDVDRWDWVNQMSCLSSAVLMSLALIE